MDDDAYVYTTTVTSIPMIDPSVFIFLSFLWATLVVVLIIAAWNLFKKAGKPGWAAIVPFYNTWVMVQIAKLSPLWFILLFIPLANLVAIVVIYHNLSKVFGRGVGTTLLMLFFPYITFPYLAFSKNVVYVDAASAQTTAAPKVTTPPVATPPTTPAV